MVELATCSWRGFRPEMGVPCRITLGKPPAWFRHEHERIRELAPPGYVFGIEDWTEFRKAYRHHLHRTTAARIQRRFEEISERHGGRRLVLLCFEAKREDCHRGLWAEWWQQQTGEHVVELQPAGPPQEPESPQLSLFGEERA